jgi:hypothetical protein
MYRKMATEAMAMGEAKATGEARRVMMTWATATTTTKTAVLLAKML